MSAGYPDLLIKGDDLPEGTFTERPNSKALQKHHTFDAPIYDAREVFGAIGLELMVIDRARYEDSENVVDLNDAVMLSNEDGSLFDLVIDPGTIEHCWDIGQAASNLANAVKLGGYISHSTPISMFNHGYYNLNPLWFWDFYNANGFEIRRLSIVDRHGGEFSDFDATSRLGNVPDNCAILCLAQRVEIKPLEVPQQK